MNTSRENKDCNTALDIIVLGASGNLAVLKIFPALFALFSQGLLPKNVHFYGFARSALSPAEFRKKIMLNLTCRYTPQHSCGTYIENFLDRCTYCRGEYGEAAAFKNLAAKLIPGSNRIFYFALPSEMFPPAARAIGTAELRQGRSSGWTRAVIEKPFGRDRESSDALNAELLRVFTEEQLYRIDHYLGKEIVQNIMVIRFANQIFKPLWNSKYIKNIIIDWQEDIGVEGRGGYFDDYGIIRDVIQNHLLQVLTLIAMDEPDSLAADAIRNRKLEVLAAIGKLTPDNIILGQYARGEKNGRKFPAYTEDPTVPDNSLTPTFANVRLKINTRRWRGVPFIIRAGKGLPQKKSEIRILFRQPEGNIFCELNACPPLNELIIRIQPDEGIHFNIVSKVPGLKMQFQTKELDLSYDSAFADTVIPEAYESLLLDVINGEKALFIRSDELAAAWDIFTPALHRIEKEKIKPKLYPFGSRGPFEAYITDCVCGKK
ncbi:MAG: glucose-6-phosphate dehydrogenase [Victivallales bacterium]|nr:glucose-6-phosphate dehydrogenase [Victivallales bacterium]